MRYLLICILFFILVMYVYVSYVPLPVYTFPYHPEPDSKTSYNLSEGEKIVKQVCFQCHYNPQTNTLAGRQHGNPERLGDFYSGNITNDSATGIGNWSPKDIYVFLRTGVKPDGTFVFDMPKYPNLSDEEVWGIVAFLKGSDPLVTSTYFPNPKPDYSLLTKLLLHTVLRPVEMPGKPIQKPNEQDTLAFGKYLVTAKYSCYECHSYNAVTNNYYNPEKSMGYLKGGNRHANEDREVVYSKNITGDPANGIGSWSYEQFHRALKNGIKPDGKVVQNPMFPYHLLSDQEIQSIYHYLLSCR